MGASIIQLDDDGEIVLAGYQPSRYVVRFPTEAEQAKGMTEVPRELRKKRASGNKA